MPTKADPTVVTVHYGHMEGETGVLGGDMLAYKRYTFLVDRGAGVETGGVPTAGRSTWSEILLFRDDQLVVHYRRGADNDGLVVAPAAYRDWAMLGQLELALSHEPVQDQAADRALVTVRQDFRQTQSRTDQDRSR